MIHFTDLEKQLKEKIIGQDDAIRVLSLTIYKHLLKLHARQDYNLDINSKNHLLITGPTGCGKTALLKATAEICELPLLIINSKSLAQEGWHGTSLAEQIHIFMAENQCHPNVEYSIIVLDEFDKLMFSNSTSGGEDYNQTLQFSMLSYIEGHTGKFSIDNKRIGVINTNNLLFIFTGAFTNLYKDFISKKPIGYNYHSDEEQVSIETALEKYGMIPELLGRISRIITLRQLDKQDFIDILKNKNSALYIWQNYFETFGAKIDQNINLEEIADKAVKKKLGARGLMQFIDEYVDNIIVNNSIYFKYRFNSTYTFLDQQDIDKEISDQFIQAARKYIKKNK